MSFAQLTAFRIIGGMGIGVVSIVSPLYISELSVAQYRGRLVSLYQLAITIGFLGAYLVNYQLLSFCEIANFQTNSSLNLIFIEQVWRGMLGMETLPALLFLIVIFFIPESPRWLILKDDEIKAEKVLNRVYNKTQIVKHELSMILNAINSEGKSDWKLLLQPGIKKAIIIGVSIAILGQIGRAHV